jgi:hypothetical protein
MSIVPFDSKATTVARTGRALAGVVDFGDRRRESCARSRAHRRYVPAED